MLPCAAAKRKHAAKRPRKKKEHLWGLGENAATIPRRMLDLLAEAELPTTADFAANGFTPRPAEYAEHVIKVLNDNEGDLPGIDLAAKVGVEWPNLGYTLRPLQTLGCVERASRHRGTRERDRIMLVASGVRRLPRVNASQHVSSRRLSRDVAKTLDTVDPAGVRNWALKRHLIETVAPRRLLTHEQLAIEMGCSPGTLYGDKKYPGPLPELKRDGVVKTHREAAGTVFEVDLLRISELYPVLPDGHRASTISRRRQRLGAKRRCWDRLDAEMRNGGKSLTTRGLAFAILNGSPPTSISQHASATSSAERMPSYPLASMFTRSPWLHRRGRAVTTGSLRSRKRTDRAGEKAL